MVGITGYYQYLVIVIIPANKNIYENFVFFAIFEQLESKNANITLYFNYCFLLLYFGFWVCKPAAARRGRRR